ncbi:TetR/AcrR family transcriptional regulator [Qipengyuania qiaonensis]|uniref:TetR/AcrR family transcriptional regulator n=1 Tax=Qipengyuania qiaonensis TaxID=2867240 RepID=A0ABS7J0R2_9SPHN|nr:TetR/AcrR family transcriptional regulator [Qipengyuania qiaonensis]MBX7480941.1 TetR/AcrR family transcriptional regulator [Qipengyuania qiaonensis]
MDERACRVAQAGYEVISQYGIRRATMNDIAVAAGVSRQTVYNIFPNREELLGGVVRYHFNSKWRAIREAIANIDDRHERISVLLDMLVVSSWESMQAMPHADELELELDTTMRRRLDDIHKEAMLNLCEFFLPYENKLAPRGISARGIAEMLHLSIVGLKLSSTSREQIETVVATMKACLIAITDDALCPTS